MKHTYIIKTVNIMTEELIKSITAAEEECVEMKRLALEKATAILSDAEEKAKQIRQNAAEECKAYKEAQVKVALLEAEEAYKKSLQKNKQESYEYCARVLSDSTPVVNKIVGRIVGGDC